MRAMFSRVLWCGAFAAILFRGVGSPGLAHATSVPPDHPDVVRWESDVQALEALDRASPDPNNAVLLVGSSSIRLWETAADDLAPYPVVRRGYGGARYRDLCHYVDRLVAPHSPRAIVVFVANDITSADDAPSPEEVMVDVRATHATIHARHPGVPVLSVAITPTESRWAAWPSIQRLNGLIERMGDEAPATFFLPTAARFLDPVSGTPEPTLFRDDRLHLSRRGYRIWGAAIKEALDRVVPPVAAVAE